MPEVDRYGADELARDIRDAARWRHAVEHHVAIACVNEDGSNKYFMVGQVGDAETIEEAIDAAMRSRSPTGD